MAHHEELASRVREALAGEPDLSERRMFGGLAFLVGGRMAVAVRGQGGLMVRCDPDDAPALLREAHVAPMRMRGRDLRGWLLVEPDALSGDADLRGWVAVGTTYAGSLPRPDEDAREGGTLTRRPARAGAGPGGPAPGPRRRSPPPRR